MNTFELIKTALGDAFTDSLQILVFLYITYFLMELFERNAGVTGHYMLSRFSKAGPLLGSVLGVIPQCGLSAVSASLFSGEMLTIGTMFAVFLSTSDEMLPILISEQIAAGTIFKILGTKILLGIFWGYIVELIFIKKKPAELHVPSDEELLEREACNCCKPPIWLSALTHALKVFFFIVVVSFVLDLIVESIGANTIGTVFADMGIFSEFIAGLIGLIPNCASSVVLTELYLEHVISNGTMMAGLLVNAGVGLLVLFEENRPMRKNFTIAGILYAIGVVSGIVIDLLGIIF